LVVGDAWAISTAVDATGRAHGMRVTRRAGVSRYATAAVLEQASGQPAALPGVGATALLVNPADSPDAVAAGSLAYRGHFPLLYTDGAQLPPETLAALAEDNIKHVVVIGAQSQVGDEVVAALTGAGMSAQRVSGAGDPASESVAVARFAQNTLGWAFSRVDLVRGDQGAADGVATIANAGADNAALLLTNGPDNLDPALLEYLAQQAGHARRLVVVGDTTTITAAVQAAAVKALRIAG
jgi:putative cell wall-binding protein